MKYKEMKDQGLILKVDGLKKYFPVFGGMLGRRIGATKAVDGISFDIKKGEILGLVGESGCGKSTTGRTIMNIYEPDEGEIFFADSRTEKIIRLPSKRNMDIVRKNMGMIFQDPYASLNPRMTIERIVAEPLIINQKELTGKDRHEVVRELLRKVGLDTRAMRRYPHEFSGGQRQRIGIARALALKPQLVVADEPVSALDVSIQSQVINLMRRLQDEMGLTYLFIAHDLSVVEYISDRVCVMYLGTIVEIAESADIYNEPMHPYTKALLSSIPVPDPEHRNREKIKLTGDVPSPSHKPSGCPFRTRCMYAEEICAEKTPELRDFGRGHKAACHFAEKL